MYFWTLNFFWLIKCLFMARMRGTTAQHVPLETVWSKKSGYSYKFYIKNWNL